MGNGTFLGGRESIRKTFEEWIAYMSISPFPACYSARVDPVRSAKMLIYSGHMTHEYF